MYLMGFPGGPLVENPPTNAGDLGSIPGSGSSPGEGKWQPTPVFLPGKSHGQRSLPGYSPWGCKRVGHNLVTKPSPSPYPYYSESQATCWGKLYQNWEFSIEVLQSLPIWTFLHIVGPKRFLFMNESILC